MKSSILMFGLVLMAAPVFAESDAHNLVLEVPTHFSSFVSDYNLEANIDLARINREREEIMATLFRSMSDVERTQLLNRTLTYKSGQLKLISYISDIVKLCEKYDIELVSYTSFEQYLRYLLIIDGVPSTQFLS